MAETEKKQRKYKRGENPNSRKNLKEFKPGKSGNPNGRPLGAQDRKSLLNYWLGQESEFKNEIRDAKGRVLRKRLPGLPAHIPGQLYDLVTLGVIEKAMRGDVAAFKEIQDSIHGKQVEKSEVDLNVSQIEVVFKKA